MKQNIFTCLVVSLFLSSCVGRSYITPICYENEMFAFQIEKNGNNVCDFKLTNKTSSVKIQGEASLIEIEGVVPECGLVEDYNNLNDLVGFQCDSTYSYIGSNINMSFAFEINNRKRMDLEIWQSTTNDFPVGGFTLQRTDTKK